MKANAAYLKELMEQIVTGIFFNASQIPVMGEVLVEAKPGMREKREEEKRKEKEKKKKSNLINFETVENLTLNGEGEK